MKVFSRWGAGLAALLGLSLLAGCQSNKMESAWSLIREQREQQFLMQQSEQEVAVNKRRSMLSMIRETQRQGRDFASLAYIESYRQHYGDSDDLLVLQADALRRTGQDAESEAVYRQLLTGKKAAQGWHGLGLLAGSTGNYASAVQSLERAAQLVPTNSQVLGDLGYARLRVGDTTGARVPLGKAAELDPNNTKGLSNMALLLIVEGNTEKAQELMDRAMLEPETRDQIYELAEEIRVQRLVGVPVNIVDTTTHVASISQDGGEPSQILARPDAVLPMLQPVMERMLNPPLMH